MDAFIQVGSTLPPVLIPFLGAMLAVWLALRRFRMEQVWLKRFDAYTQIPLCSLMRPLVTTAIYEQPEHVVAYSFDQQYAVSFPQ